MKSRIAIIVPYFGKFPEYFPVFLKSLKANPLISYHFWTENPRPESAKDIDNVFFHNISFKDYCEKVSYELDIDFTIDNPYKLCDVRPFYSYIHRKELSGYDFVGFGDIDLIFGDIQGYIEPVIDRLDFFSTHADRISGHLCFYRNDENFRNLAFKILNWQSVLSKKDHYGIDEGAFCDVVSPLLGYSRRIWHHLSARMDFSSAWRLSAILSGVASTMLSKKLHFKELHTTHCAISRNVLDYRWTDDAWVYDGKNIIGQNNGRRYPYLHFLFLKSDNYLPVQPIWGDDYYKVADVDRPIVIDRYGMRNV